MVNSRSTSNSIFVVQEHHASHLHWDFRLEISGVLASWAVPKGPSMEEGVKRLAMKVEDHDMAYANFEGSIPEGSYGAGKVIMWDKGTFSTVNDESIKDSLEKGTIEVILKGDKLKGKFSLVKMKSNKFGKGEAWLLMKIKD